jgi:hypothetical protein
MCLPSCCLEAGCITQFFHCCSVQTTYKTQPHLLLCGVGPCLQSYCWQHVDQICYNTIRNGRKKLYYPSSLMGHALVDKQAIMTLCHLEFVQALSGVHLMYMMFQKLDPLLSPDVGRGGQECDALMQATEREETLLATCFMLVSCLAYFSTPKPRRWRQDVPVGCLSTDSKFLIPEYRTLHNTTMRTSNPT